jgi:hypothetical protein
MTCSLLDGGKQRSRKDYAQTKTKKVAWFVSHCETSSHRELYAKELVKHIDVDIFGGCGNNSVCPRLGGCFQEILAPYKFYLSFENAFCKEYYTEKLHDVVKQDILPIVLGDTDYNSLLPPEMFLNIRDFRSPKELADHLLRLDSNDKLYNAHLRAKEAYRCAVSYAAEHRFPCKLCEYVHRYRGQRQQVLDAASFWSVAHRCTDPRDYYRGIADEIIPKIKFKYHPHEFL